MGRHPALAVPLLRTVALFSLPVRSLWNVMDSPEWW
jgi:hypothetical protein